jgi:hypothetical protein
VLDVRSITGFGNNIANPTFGEAGTDLIRIAPAAYADGVSAPAGANRPGARFISNTLSDQTDPANPSQDLSIQNTQALSDFIYVFGQFLDHDLDLTKDNSGQPFDILPGSSTDPMGTEPFTRSQFDPNTGLGLGTPFPVGADLTGAFNRTGIVNDGSTFTGGGFDGDGFALSANLLGSAVTFNGASYALGTAGINDVASASGQTVILPGGNASAVTLLAAGVNGNQPNQTFTFTYTDGSTQTFTQSISDWFTPQNYPGESTAVTMPYRDTASGGTDNRTFQVYAYSFNLNAAKQVQSIKLPNDSNVEVLAIDVTRSPTTVNLSGAFNRTGIVRDGSIFLSGGFDGDGNALSANLIDSAVTFNGASYALGAPGVKDVVSASGQTITLPGGNASAVSLLAAGVNGNQANQTFTVTYTDGSTQTFTQSISDWFTPQNYPGESTAVTMPYRDTFFGGRDNRTFQVYAYSFSVDPDRAVQSIKLPNDANVEVLALDVTPTDPRQQIQADTSFIDGSQIYGSDPAKADALRTHSGGRLKDSTQGGAEFLPFNNTTNFTTPIDMANDAHLVPDSQLYAAGDRRANETSQLISMHTLFLREHNRLADQFAAANPTWTDEQIYQAARRQVGAELEVIVYNEWIPALLGPNALPAYTGYKPNVNPGIANEFSTAMFRFAHSQLDNDVERKNNDGTDDPAGSIPLDQSFFDPNLIHLPATTDPVTGLTSTGISPILKGAASANAQNVDLLAVRSVRNFLFGPPGAGGTDLIARDIQRGRDHGLTDYNSMRAAYGLPKVTSFAQITSDPTVQQELQQVYGNVNNIDAFVGALAEDHAPGAAVGPLTRAVLVNQFTRTRDGDRFFYLNQFSGTELQNLLANTSLAKIIERDTAVNNLQADVFHFRASISGTVFDDDNRNGVFDSFEHGFAGITVNLADDTGTVIATATTDANGFYKFTEQDLNGTGNYTVSVVVPSGDISTTPTSVAVSISRGDINATVNFGLDATSGWSGPPRTASSAAGTTSAPAGSSIVVGQPPAPAGSGGVVTVFAPPSSGSVTQATSTGQALPAAPADSGGGTAASPALATAAPAPAASDNQQGANVAISIILAGQQQPSTGTGSVTVFAPASGSVTQSTDTGLALPGGNLGTSADLALTGPASSNGTDPASVMATDQLFAHP